MLQTLRYTIFLCLAAFACDLSLAALIDFDDVSPGSGFSPLGVNVPSNGVSGGVIFQVEPFEFFPSGWTSGGGAAIDAFGTLNATQQMITDHARVDFKIGQANTWSVEYAHQAGNINVQLDGTTLYNVLLMTDLPTIDSRFSVVGGPSLGKLVYQGSDIVEFGIGGQDLIIDNLEFSLSDTAGDLNGDGSVDAADAMILFRDWHGNGRGDLNGDGMVDAADAGLLFSSWTGDNAAPHPVPEPASAWLCLAATAAIRARRMLAWRRAAA